MGIVFFYAVLGGMKGITYTQIAQYVVLIFACRPAVFISLNLTGNPIPQLGLGGSTVDGTPSRETDKVVTDLGFNEYTSVNGGKLNMFVYTLTLMIGTAGRACDHPFFRAQISDAVFPPVGRLYLSPSSTPPPRLGPWHD